ncbi:MAG: hypothetical protein ACT4QD_03455 [Acidobacteriota bacterium]
MNVVSARQSVGVLAVAALLSGGLLPWASAQDSPSIALVQELTGLLKARKLDSIAARYPKQDDQFVAALYFPELLLVVSARTVAPAILNEKLVRKQFRDVYIDLNSASIPETRVMFSDGGADGLRSRREPNMAFDSQDASGKSMQFDGNWREDRMTEEDYMKRFAQADAAYVLALQALLAELKKP